MKTLKKLTAVLASLILSMSTLSSFPANAFYSHILTSDSSVLEGYSLVDDGGFFSELLQAPCKIYTNGSPFDLLCIRSSHNEFSFSLLPDVNFDEAHAIIEAAIGKYTPDCNISYSDYDTRRTYRISDSSLNPETLINSRLVCNELKDAGLIDDFHYAEEIGELLYMSYDYLTALPKDYAGVTVDIELLNTYIKENNLDCTVVEVTADNAEMCNGGKALFDSYCVVPNEEISLEQHLAIAGQIYSELGYTAIFQWPATGEQQFCTEVYDIYNLNTGDANLDSTVDATDASDVLLKYVTAQTSDVTMQSNDWYYALYADVNFDSHVDASDASLILKMYAENQTS